MAARKKTSKGLCRVTATYRIKLSDGKEEKRVKGFERKTWKEADAAKAKFLEELGKPKAPEVGTLAELFEMVDAHVWIHLKGKGTRENYNSYRGQCERAMGGRNVAEITPPEITRYLAKFAHLSDRTISEHVVVLSSAFRYAISDLGWRTDDPAKMARKPKGKATPKKPALTRAVLDEILPHLPETERLFCRLMADTGMREIEMFATTSEHVVWRFDRYWIDVRESKTRNGIRVAPLSSDLAADLQRAGDPFRDLRALDDPDARIWREWRKAYAAANELRKTRHVGEWDPKKHGVPYSTPYKMRAMRLTEWARDRMDRDILAVIAGHSDASVTDQFYVFLEAEDAANALRTIGVPKGVGLSTDAALK